MSPLAPPVSASETEAAALRLLLALTLSAREAAALLVQGAALEVDGVWPSVVVAGLAEAMVAEPSRWPAVAALLDRRLAPWLAGLVDRPIREVVARLPRDEASVDIASLAALLWSLVRRRQPALMAVLARVLREVERLIAADAGRRACPRHLPGAVDLRGA